MAGRSPARYLAPLALVAVVIALIVVVNGSRDEPSGGNTPNQTSTTRPNSTPSGSSKRERKGPRRYTVKSGDTPSSIADKTGIPLEQILRLNPDLDPQTLSPGERIRLRQ
jgi:LysM repeat protein